MLQTIPMYIFFKKKKREHSRFEKSSTNVPSIRINTIIICMQYEDCLALMFFWMFEVSWSHWSAPARRLTAIVKRIVSLQRIPRLKQPLNFSVQWTVLLVYTHYFIAKQRVNGKEGFSHFFKRWSIMVFVDIVHTEKPTSLPASLAIENFKK